MDNWELNWKKTCKIKKKKIEPSCTPTCVASLQNTSRWSSSNGLDRKSAIHSIKRRVKQAWEPPASHSFLSYELASSTQPLAIWVFLALGTTLSDYLGVLRFAGFLSPGSLIGFCVYGSFCFLPCFNLELALLLMVSCSLSLYFCLRDSVLWSFSSWRRCLFLHQ